MSRYRPAGEDFDHFPRFQTRDDAMAYVLAMEPMPEEFSAAPLARRLRLRQAKQKETKVEVAQQRSRAMQRTGLR